MTKQEIYQVLEAKKIILKNLSCTELDKFTKKKTLVALSLIHI